MTILGLDDQGLCILYTLLKVGVVIFLYRHMTWVHHCSFAN